MYKLRARRGLLWFALLVVIVGGLLSAHFFAEDAFSETHRGALVLIITLVLALLLVVAATAHFWFRHLWHHRPGYKRG